MISGQKIPKKDKKSGFTVKVKIGLHAAFSNG